LVLSATLWDSTFMLVTMLDDACLTLDTYCWAIARGFGAGAPVGTRDGPGTGKGMMMVPMRLA